MGKVIRQPNGEFAIYSSIADDFTWVNLDEVGVFKALLFDELSIDAAWKVTHNAMAKEYDKEAFEEAIEMIRVIHGDEVVEQNLEAMGIKNGTDNEQR